MFIFIDLTLVCNLKRKASQAMNDIIGREKPFLTMQCQGEGVTSITELSSFPMFDATEDPPSSQSMVHNPYRPTSLNLKEPPSIILEAHLPLSLGNSKFPLVHLLTHHQGRLCFYWH